MNQRNYSKWAKVHTDWFGLESFRTTEYILDGTHTFHLENSQIEFLFQDSPLTSSYSKIPVFFSGAIPKRSELTAPFFSGVTIYKSLNIPYIAISDPLVDRKPDLTLGWYAGSYGEGLQRKISTILSTFIEKSGKDLLFIGGSGVGFASLYYASRIKQKCHALVWNPQTSILDYWETAVKNFLKAAGASSKNLEENNWKKIIYNWRKGKIDIELLKSNHFHNTSSILYLQNKSDWHLKKHAEPWIDASSWKYINNNSNDIYRYDDKHLVIISDFADGHSPIPRSLLSQIIRSLIVDNVNPFAVYNSVIEGREN